MSTAWWRPSRSSGSPSLLSPGSLAHAPSCSPARSSLGTLVPKAAAKLSLLRSAAYEPCQVFAETSAPDVNISAGKERRLPVLGLSKLCMKTLEQFGVKCCRGRGWPHLSWLGLRALLSDKGEVHVVQSWQSSSADIYPPVPFQRPECSSECRQLSLCRCCIALRHVQNIPTPVPSSWKAPEGVLCPASLSIRVRGSCSVP